MKIINEEFQEMTDTNNIFEGITYQIIEFLRARISDEQLLNDIIDRCNDIIVQQTNGETFSIKLPNGSLKKNRIPSNVGALKTNMIIDTNEHELYITPGIALRPNYNNHQLIHEILHSISSKKRNSFNEEGVTYTKTGTKIDYYDNKLNNYYVDDNYSSDGLNEGITELLASMITNEFTGNYPGFVVAAEMLMACNDKLLKAYFSDSLEELKNFYSDLEERQSVITRHDLYKFDSKIMDDDLLVKIMVGAIKYNESYNHTIDIDRLTNHLDRYYMLDYGSWSDLILNKLNDTMTKVI